MNSGKQIDFEEYLSRYGSLTYKNRGTSMMPLLRQDRDLFTLVIKGPKRCKKNDVVLYKGPQGRYILHRVVRVLPEGYLIRGDNTYVNEFRTDGEIIGVMTGFIRDGREYTVTDAGYRLYSVMRNISYPFRYVYSKIIRAAGRFMDRRKKTRQ